LTRRLLRSLSRVLIGVVLMAQVAISAYACPGLAMTTMPLASASSDSDQADVNQGSAVRPMVNCQDMDGATDPSFANLCAEHCRYGQQSDQVPTLTVPPALLIALYFTPVAPEPIAVPHPAADATSALVAASPPLAIRHCCFRI
jgi:hypothetical protein